MKYDRLCQIVKEDRVIINGGSLHKDGIFLIAELGGREKSNAYLMTYCMPKFRERGNEWFTGPYYEDFALKENMILSESKLFMGITYWGDVLENKGLEKSFNGFELNEKKIPVNLDGLRNDVATGITEIDGVIYVCGESGTVYRRLPNDDWEEFASKQTKKVFNTKKRTSEDAFDTIAGFSKDEIYAGGKNGILWLYEDGLWRPLDLPCNDTIWQIVCAPDGYVYINSYFQILKGRKDEWEVITPTIPANQGVDDIAWFKGKLYMLPGLASAVGLYCLDEQGNTENVEVGSFSIDPDKMINDNLLTAVKVENSETKVFIPPGVGTITANEDLLMITGHEDVILFNGDRWSVLFDKRQTEEDLREKGVYYDPREL